MIFHFGPLIRKWTIRFNGGSIEPVQDFDVATASINAQTHQDGFLYPPTNRDVVIDPSTGQTLEDIPKTQRPARLFRLPPTHTLDLPDIASEEPHRETHAFNLHLLGYLFGVSPQFSDWYFDRRVQIQLLRTHNIDYSPDTCQSFLSHCYDLWGALRAEERRLFVNVLAMHCRAPSYYWDWEQFMMEYTVLDSCWKLASGRRGLPAKTPHEKRITVMCKDLGVRYQDDGSTHIREIVRLRKDLFHEATWDGSQPCFATGDGILQVHNLRRLNQRLVPALLGYATAYVSTPWWIIDTFGFVLIKHARNSLIHYLSPFPTLRVIFHEHSATCFSRPFHQARRSELCCQPIT